MKQFSKTVTQVSVRPGDLDSVGHVNNARVLEYLEHGRWDWLRKNGLSSGKNVIPVVVRIEADYRAEIPWGDIRVETDMQQGEDLTFKAIFNQFVYVESSNEAAAKAVVHVAFIDANERSVCTVKDYIDDATMAREGRNSGTFFAGGQ